MIATLLFAAFAVLMFLGVPIGAALGLAGVPFDVEVGDGAPDGGALLDLFHRALWPSSAAGRGPDGQGRAGLNP